MFREPHLKIFARHEVFKESIELAIFRERHEIGVKKRDIARIEWTELTEARLNDSVFPTITLDLDQAQRLMDSLWECGLRPIGGKGSAGQLEATKYHLEDMRQLVFEKRPGGQLPPLGI